MSELLRVRNVEKVYGNKGNLTYALSGVSFEVEEGEYVTIMGASGSGKTTLLNCIATIDSVTSGHIYIDDVDITSFKSKDLAKFRRENMGFVFQDYNLLDTLTGRENIALALSIIKYNSRNIEARIDGIASKLNIVDVLDKYPYQMSGGQQQRVACARAIITDPSIILADEPTGALDSKSAKMALNSFKKLNEELDATILMVTHDAYTASFSNRVIFIKDGKVFSEIVKGIDSRSDFFDKIIGIISLMGGEIEDVE